MREPITKEYLNSKDPLGYGFFLKCDIPIWEEFTVGLIHQGGWATDNIFSGVRTMTCRVSNTKKYKEICIVTKNPKSQKLFEFMRDGYTDRNKELYKNVNISEYDRLDKKVYVIEYEYNR
jgi:hypothetical protein